MTIDPRLTERRREVAEDRARRNVRRLIRFLVTLGLAGAVVWLFLSPLLSVKEVTTTGVVASSTHLALAEEGVLAGTPMILIRTGDIAADLERDPWVREAVVSLDWPNRVLVRVEERVPVAWVETGDGWARRAIDGIAVPSAGEPDDSMPWLDFSAIEDSEAPRSRQVLGALEFAAALPDDLKSGTRVWSEANGEIWADVSGFDVRLGRPVEMADKGLSLAALLREQPPQGSILTLIAPTHPAVSSSVEEPPSKEEEP